MTESLGTLSIDITAQTTAFDKGLGHVESSLLGAKGQFSGIGSQIGTGISQGIGLGIGLGVVGITAELTKLGGSVISMAMDWESAFAGVEKTVDGTAEQLALLEDQLLGLSVGDSPVAGLDNAALQLAGIAEAAGQLGVAREHIAGFTETIALLDMTTNLAGEQGATMIAQFANITGMDLSNIDRLGSAIVALGNDGASTEAQIVEFAHRLAGAGDQAGMTEAEILALASAMASTGLNAEAGGTAMTEVFNTMAVAAAKGGKSLDTFAKISGVSAESFADTWRSEPTEALTLFLEGLGDLDQAAQLDALEALELDGIRTSDTLRRLSGNVGLVEDALTTANTAWDENTALMTEAEKRAATTEAQWNALENKFKMVAMVIGGELLPVTNDSIDTLGLLVDAGAEILGIDLGFEVTGDAPDLAAEAQRIIGPMPPPVDVTVPTFIEYEIKPGDNFYSIAAQFPGMSAQEIMAANPEMAAADYIFAGDTMLIPVPAEMQFDIDGQVVGRWQDVNAVFHQTNTELEQMGPSSTKVDELSAKLDELFAKQGLTTDFGLALDMVGTAISSWGTILKSFDAFGDILTDTEKLGEALSQLGDFVWSDSLSETWGEIGDSIPVLMDTMGLKVELEFLDMAEAGVLAAKDIAEAWNDLEIAGISTPDVDTSAADEMLAVIEGRRAQVETELSGNPLTIPIIPTVEEMSTIPPIEIPVIPQIDEGAAFDLDIFDDGIMKFQVQAEGLDTLIEETESWQAALGTPLSVTVGEDSYASVADFQAAVIAGTYDTVEGPLEVTVSQASHDGITATNAEIENAVRDRDTSVMISSNAAEVDSTITAAARDREAEIRFRLTQIGATIGGETIEERAGGGPVAGNTPYLIGENGPELFVPDTSGQIIPNHDLAGMGSGGAGLSGNSGGGGIQINGPIYVQGVQNADQLLDELVAIAHTRAHPGFAMAD